MNKHEKRCETEFLGKDTDMYCGRHRMGMYWYIGFGGFRYNLMAQSIPWGKL